MPREFKVNAHVSGSINRQRPVPAFFTVTLKWQWKIQYSKMYFLLKMGIFRCHVSFYHFNFKQKHSKPNAFWQKFSLRDHFPERARLQAAFDSPWEGPHWCSTKTKYSNPWLKTHNLCCWVNQEYLKGLEVWGAPIPTQHNRVFWCYVFCFLVKSHFSTNIIFWWISFAEKFLLFVDSIGVLFVFI